MSTENRPDFSNVRLLVYQAGVFVFGTVNRFLMILGIVLIVAGALRGDGIMAAHLGIYGASSFALGALIWAILHTRG